MGNLSLADARKPVFYAAYKGTCVGRIHPHVGIHGIAEDVSNRLGAQHEILKSVDWVSGELSVLLRALDDDPPNFADRRKTEARGRCLAQPRGPTACRLGHPFNHFSIDRIS